MYATLHPISWQISSLRLKDSTPSKCEFTPLIFLVTIFSKTGEIFEDFLEFDATRRRANVHRNPATSPALPFPHRPMPVIDPQRPVFPRYLRKTFLPPSITDVAAPSTIGPAIS
ncbi:hypothetical protein M405DRAFT_428458 [Rhizopogon salebrosus TDB-379]|nr:hypothetical protein M405DRAFT_428458 [Rhizopogon salebrosus TDB-379]